MDIKATEGVSANRRRYFARCAISAITALALAISMCALPVKQADAGTLPVRISVKYAQTDARSMLKMINDFRAQSPECWNETNTGKDKYPFAGNLSYDYGLEKVAMQRAAELALLFAHERPNGEICFTAQGEFGFNSMWGENIAVGTGNVSARSAFEMWKEEFEKYEGQGHRRNMLDSAYASVGIGCAKVGGKTFWVQNFGNPNTGVSATVAQDSTNTVGVNVLDSNINKKTLTASKSSLALSTGERASIPSLTMTLGLKGNWLGGTVSPLTSDAVWASSNPSVVAIYGGKIVAKKKGSATLTASIYGSKATVKVVVAKKPAATSLKSVRALGGKKVSVKWKKAKNVSGYQIACSTSKKFTKPATVTKIAKKASVSATIKAKAKKTSYVRIRTYSKTNGVTIYSNWSKVKSVKVK